MDTTPKLHVICFVLTIYTILHMDGVHCALSTCGGTLRNRTQTFTSPNYPHSPKRDPEAAAVGTFASDDDDDLGIVTCEWKIIVSAGHGIQLNFGDFDMAAGLDECTKGELEVFAGIDDEKRSMDKYCGSDELGTLQLKTNEATVVFRRPSDFSGKGFLVSYIETKPGVVIDDFITCVDRGSDHVGVGSYSVLCPGGCAGIADMSIRGIGLYRDDSYLCKAAVHAGVISDASGGRIDVKKLPGKTLYMGSEANGVTSEAGAMSDTEFGFIRPDAGCDDRIEIQKNQLTASSYWTGDITDPGKTKWRPDQAILRKQIEAWSPNSPTKEQWLQVDLKEPKVVTAITTRGSSNKYYTTKSYRIAFRNSTGMPWKFYKEDDVSHEKVFVGNQHIFKEMRNNFIHPRVVGRFIRIYPTPVETEKWRYCLQLALSGCNVGDVGAIDLPAAPEEPSKPAMISIGLVETSTKMTQESSKIVDSEGNASMNPRASPRPPSNIESTSNGGIVIKKPISPTEGEKPTINESGIIVIAIIAALAVTSILLAALVLILVRKRKKKPKDDSTSTIQTGQAVQNNNNSRFSYKSKKSRKRNGKNVGVLFENPDYRGTLLKVTLPPNTSGAFSGSHGGAAPGFQQIGSSAHAGDESDSFITDDDGDHEYQVIEDEHLIRKPTAAGSGYDSKVSTASTLEDHSWGVDGNEWRNHPQNPPLVTMPGSNHPHVSTFAMNSLNNEVLSHPKQSQINGNHSFPHETNFPTGEPQFAPANTPKGAPQPLSFTQRHSSSSNNSSHGAPLHPHDPSDPYYSSVPDSACPSHVTGGVANPDQIAGTASSTKRAPSYKVPRPLMGGIPALPDKVGARGIPAVQNGGVSLSGRGQSASPSSRSDYDRLCRNDGLREPADNTNNFSLIGGSHSQYNQLNLNGANV